MAAASHELVEIGWITFGLRLSLTLFITLFFALRMYVRFIPVNRFGLDDVFVILAYVFNLGYSAVDVLGTYRGLESQGNSMPGHEIAHIVFSSFITPIFYILSTTFVKLVALSLYLRMNHEKLRITSLIVMGFVCLQAVAFGIAAIFQCVPVQAAWDMTIKDRQCYAIDNYFICQTALNFATDLIVYVLPLPVISRLHVPMKKKVVLGFFMGLGLFACITNIVRLHYNFILKNSPYNPELFTALPAKMSYWGGIEANIGFVVVSLPPLAPLAHSLVPRIFAGPEKEANGQARLGTNIHRSIGFASFSTNVDVK